MPWSCTVITNLYCSPNLPCNPLKLPVKPPWTKASLSLHLCTLITIHQRVPGIHLKPQTLKPKQR